MDFEDQEKFLEDSKRIVKEQAYFMKRALDTANLRDALRHSSLMISELRTQILSPKTYYILFMQVFEELQHLQQYFKEEYRRGRRMADLYESVQHAQNIVPRLYLLITVGAVYIQTQEVRSKEILSDLLEMIKGVQNPLKGLFLRYYFLKLCKDKLPDLGNEYYTNGQDISDAINCILNNLAEMNKLWIRMQGKQEKAKREKERIDLKVTVSENLHRLSQLEGVTIEIYSDYVLPKLMELIISSNDQISQQHLIDVIIQTFPNEFHLRNLKFMLELFTSKLVPSFDLKTIFIRLMDRLSDYASNENEQSNFDENAGIYQMFKVNIDKIIVDGSKQLEFNRLLDLQVYQFQLLKNSLKAAFLKFSLKCYPQNASHVNEILKSACMICGQHSSIDFDENSYKNIVKFLTLPLESLSLQILTMNEFPNLMQYLQFDKKRLVANRIAEVNANQVVIQLQQQLEDPYLSKQLIMFIEPMLKPNIELQESDIYQFEIEQNLVARIVHLVKGDNLKNIYAILNQFQDIFLQGSIQQKIITLPSLIFSFIQFIRTIYFFQKNNQQLDADKNTVQEGIFDLYQLAKNIKNLIDKIVNDAPSLSLKLYIDLCLCINLFDSQDKKFDEFTYNTFAEAMEIYQEQISNTDEKVYLNYLLIFFKNKIQLLNLMIGSITQIECLSQENKENLCDNIASYSSKLLKKFEQCQAVLQCIHLFYNDHYINEKKVLECFKRALKLASISIDQNIIHVELYIKIAEKFIFFIKHGISNLQISDLQECINLVSNKLKQLQKDNSNKYNELKDYYKRLIYFISSQKQQGDQKLLEQLKIVNE